MNQKKVLIVDDTIMIRLLIEHILKEMGYVYQTADNGIEAVKLLKNESFDLILLDIEMPEMDGWKTMEKIREDNIIPINTPIVAMTGHTDISIRNRLLSKGFSSVLGKPFDNDVLYEILNKYLNQ